ncbi:DUF1398 family protein [Escherichia coli]|uniref:DUF1398 family protein n=1 Tax=Escherichia coli TaxID=562 RepID=UPI000A1888A6|nr:DUF1398 family protein [Escherichia coli]OSL95251.1 putative cytoplasmic protein [Escherichia coli T426]
MSILFAIRDLFDHVRHELNFPLFYCELKRHKVTYYIYYLSTDNIRVITSDNEKLLIKGRRCFLKISSVTNPDIIKKAAQSHTAGHLSFYDYCTTLAAAGVFKWVTDINNNTRLYYSHDNSVLYIEDVENNRPLI